MGSPVGVRLPDDLLERIEELSREEGDDRSATIRKLIQRGFDDLCRERAAQGYRAGRMTLSEAAEVAGMTLWEMERYLVERGYRSSYSIEDLERELELLDADRTGGPHGP